MNRLDRALGILLLLRSGRPASAAELAERFGVSARTIYRDVETLAAVGVPVYAEMGRAGGFRLVEGYFLPPVMFSVGEAVSLLLGLNALRHLRAKPFAAELETAEHKLLAAVPDHLRTVLAQIERLIGFETTPADMFAHPELESAPEPEARELSEDRVVTVFLQAVLDRRELRLDYRSPYSGREQTIRAWPRGLVWDRDRWYLVGAKAGAGGGSPRMWRADRVRAIAPLGPAAAAGPSFDVNSLLGRKWLGEAMANWIREAPVEIEITNGQAERLRRDWYYAHARFEPAGAGRVRMTFGQDNRDFVFELLRWLGPGAELVSPREWREAFAEELRAMMGLYR